MQGCSRGPVGPAPSHLVDSRKRHADSTSDLRYNGDMIRPGETENENRGTEGQRPGTEDADSANASSEVGSVARATLE